MAWATGQGLQGPLPARLLRRLHGEARRLLHLGDLCGEVPGGILPCSPQQLAANPTHVNLARPHQGVAAEVRKSEAAFYNREAALLSAFRKHVPVEAIQLRMDQLLQLHRADDFLAGAPVTNVITHTSPVCNK